MATVNDPMQTREYAEKYLMGSWLAEENREYIKYFDEGDFTDQYNLFKEIKKGKTLKNNLEISKAAKISVQEQIALLELYNSFPRSQQQQFFRAYSKQIITENMIKYIVSGRQDTETIDSYREKIRIIQAPEEVKQETSKEWFSEYLEEIDKRESQGVLKYNIPALNDKLGGLKRGELTVIAARPGMGKSTFAMQTAEATANEGHKVLYFNLEMTMDQIGDRLLETHTGVSHHNLINGKLTQNEWNEIVVATDRLEKVINNISFKNMNRNIDYFMDIIEEEKPALVIVDQLSHLTTNLITQSIKERFTYMLETLKDIARKKDVPIILLAQQSRNTENKGKTEPDFSDLKESGAIEETSDNVLFIYTPKDNEEDQYNTQDLECIMKIAKNRQGEQGKIDITFYKSKHTFTESKKKERKPSNINTAKAYKPK